MGTIFDAETHGKRCRRRGALAPLALLVAGGALFWTDRLWNYFPRNAPLDDALVVVVYAASYGLLTGLLAWLAWRILARVVPLLGRLDTPLGRLLTRRSGGPNLFAGALLLLPFLTVAYLGHVRHRLASPPDTGPLHMALSWSPSPYRIQLIGIDGADLRHIEELIEEGELPGFQRFLRSGASGPLETISPHSPVV
jgi:hypothetical protein